MTLNLLTRRRAVLGQEVVEPTLLAFGFVIVGVALLICVLLASIVFVPAFGFIWWTFAAAAVIAFALVASIFGRSKAHTVAPTTRQQWMRRILGGARLAFITILMCWLGLIVWLESCPGGTAPPAKDDPAFIRVITWNIHCGQEEGMPWKQFDWPARKLALQAALVQARPDILCVQEATPEQVAFLESILPGHQRVGGGRDDGKDQGEHCAIFFSRLRFEEMASRTFWLEEPIDQPRVGSAFDVKRICTWVRMCDRTSGRTLRVFNSHLYLNEAQNRTAARIILDQIATTGAPTDAVIMTADFNAKPSAPCRRLFTERGTGLVDSAERAGEPIGVPTFQLYGLGVWCIDGVLVNSQWNVREHRILDVKPHNTFPSDHFAILTDLELTP